MDKSMKSMRRFLAMLSVLLVAIMSLCSIALARAEIAQMVPFDDIRGYQDNGNEYDYVEYGRYPQTLIGEFDISSDNETVKIISNLISKAVTNISNCTVSQFFPTSKKNNLSYTLDGTTYKMTFDPNESQYYTLKTAVGDYPEGTQIYTYNQVVDYFSKYTTDLNPATTYINDASVSGIYTDSTTPIQNDGKIYLFLVEPIKWRVLDRNGDTATLMAENIIDSHSWFNNDQQVQTQHDDVLYPASGIRDYIGKSAPYFNYKIEDEGIFYRDPNSTVPTEKKYNVGWRKNGEYYQSINSYSDSYNWTYAQCKVTFYISGYDSFTIEAINSGESGYDHGILGNIDEELNGENFNASTSTSSYTFKYSFYKHNATENIEYNCKDLSEKSEHFIQIRYRKDSSLHNFNDCLKFRIISPAKSSEPYSGVVFGYSGSDIFINRAFNTEEQKALISKTISVSGLTVKSYVYIPSSIGADGELNTPKYGLNTDENRKATVTDYVKQTGTTNDGIYGEYWLRGYNIFNGEDFYVGTNGQQVGNNYTQFSTKGIRPIVQVDIRSVTPITINETEYAMERISPLRTATTESNRADFINLPSNEPVIRLYNDGGALKTAFPSYSSAKIDIGYDNTDYVASYSGFPTGGYLAMVYISDSGSKYIGAITPILTSTSGTAYISRPIDGKMLMYYVKGNNIYSCLDITSYVNCPIYVDPNNEHSGSDSNSGLTRTSPLLKLQTALSKCEPSQKIILISKVPTIHKLFDGRAGYTGTNHSDFFSRLQYVNITGFPVTLVRDFEGLLIEATNYNGITNVHFNDITFEDADSSGARSHSMIRLNSTNACTHFYFDNVTAKNINSSADGSFLNVTGKTQVFFANGCNVSNNTCSGTQGGVIYIGSEATLTIQHTQNRTFNFNNNKFASAGTGKGGVIYCAGTLSIGGSGTVYSSIINFNDNQALYGGAIYYCGSSLSFNCNTSSGVINFMRNDKDYDFNHNPYGGAIYSTGPISCVGTNKVVTMQENEAYLGGALYITAECSLYANINKNNAGLHGGAIYADGTSSISKVSAEYNYSKGGGGAIYSVNSISLTDVCIYFSNMRSSTEPYTTYNLINNGGGGVYLSSGDLTVSGTNHFYRNYSNANGAGIYCPGTVNITDGQVTMSGNQAPKGNGGAIYAKKISVGDDARLQLGVYGEGNSSSKYYLNLAKKGGGIYTKDGEKEYKNICFSGHSTESGGGGLYFENITTEDAITFTACGASTCIGKNAGILYLSGKNLIIKRSSSTLGSYTADSAHYSSTNTTSNETYTATEGSGGAFCVKKDSSNKGGNVTIDTTDYHIIFTGWYAKSDGGAIYADGDVNITLTGNSLRIGTANSNTIGNRADGSGGGIYAGGSVSISVKYSSSTTNYFSGNKAKENGGAIYSTNACTVDLGQEQTNYKQNIIFSYNESGYAGSTGNGGAVYCASSVSVAAGNSYYGYGYVTFRNNTANNGNGGAIYSSSLCKLYTGLGSGGNNYLAIYSNSANGTGGYGGGVYCASNLTLTAQFAYFNIYSNSATKDGGAIYTTGTTTINIGSAYQGSGLYSNTAGSNGGAIYSSGIVSISWTNGKGCGFGSCYGNKANGGNGGVVYCGANVTLKNSSTNQLTFGASGTSANSNYASSNGGTIYATGSIQQQGAGKIQFNYSKAGSDGGAFYIANNEQSLTLTNAGFSSCISESGKGGAIYSTKALDFSSATLSVSNCGSYSGGGAFYCTANLTLPAIAFSSCYCTSSNGGAIYAEASLSLTAGTTFTSCYCTSGNGGAIYYNGSTALSLTNITFTSCYCSSGDGGAICIAKKNVGFTMNNTGKNEVAFSGCYCTSGNGGAICTNNGSVNLTDVAMSSCHCVQGKGGAVYASSLTMNITKNLTISNCYAYDGGAIYCTGDITLNRDNSSIYYTISNNGATYVYSSSTPYNTNQVGNGGAIYSGGKVTITGAVIDNNGAKTGIYIYNGSDTTYFTSGYVYAVKGGAIYSEGDVTLKDVSLTNNKAESGGAIYCKSSVSITEPSLSRRKISGNIACGGSAIYVECTSAKSITIEGTSALNYVGNNVIADIARLVRVDSRNETRTKEISDKPIIYIKTGDITAKYVNFDALAIFRTDTGKCTVSNSTFTRSSTSGGISGAPEPTPDIPTSYPTGPVVDNGGAISASTSVTATNCSFNHCFAKTNGGAIHTGGALTVIGCYFDDCSAKYGGAIYCVGKWAISDCEFYRNRSTDSGGALYLAGKLNESDNTISNCEFNSNSATIAGGAVYSKQGIIFDRDCTFTYNESRSGALVLILGDQKYITTFDGCQIKYNKCVDENVSSGLVCYGGTFGQNFEFIGCTIEDNESQYGAVIKIANDSTVTVKNCTILNNKNTQENNSSTNYNTADYTNRGGMFFVHTGGHLIVENCHLSLNTVVSNGEGSDVYLANNSTLEMKDVTIGNKDGENKITRTSDDKYYSIYAGTGCHLSIEGLTVHDNNFGGGGVIYSCGEITIKDSTFTDLIAYQIIGNEQNSLTLFGCEVTDNSVTYHGTIYVGTNGKLISFDNLFEHNKSESAGVVAYLDSTSVASFNKTIFRDNTADGDGVVYIGATALCSITNCEFSHNITSKDIKGLCIHNEGTLSIGDSVFANHSGTNISGGAIYSTGNGSNLIVNDITIKDSNIANGQICVESSDAILEIRGLTLSNVVSGVWSDNAQLYLVNCNLTGNSFSSPIVNFTGLDAGTLGIIGTTFSGNSMSTSLISAESSNGGTTVVIDSSTFTDNIVPDSSLINLRGMDKVSIIRSKFSNNTNKNLVEINSKIVEITSCEIYGNTCTESILKTDGKGNNIHISSSVLQNNKNGSDGVLNLAVDEDSFISLRALSIIDNTTMRAVNLSGKGNIKVEGLLTITGNKQGVIASETCLELKHGLEIHITDNTECDVNLNDGSMVLLDGILDANSEVDISNITGEVISTVSQNSKLSHVYISSFRVPDGYTLVVNHADNMASIQEKTGLVTQDVVRKVSTNGYLPNVFELESSDFILNTPWENYSIEYRLSEDEEYTASAPQFTRIGEYTVYFKLTSESGEEEGSIKVCLEPQSLHLKSSPVVSVSYGSTLSQAVFTSYQVVNDENMSVSGAWTFTDALPTTIVDNILQGYTVRFTPFNTNLYGEDGITTNIILKVYFDEIYYKSQGFCATRNDTSSLAGIDTLSDALEYMNDYGTIHFLSTYNVTGVENISASRSIYFAKDFSPVIIQVGSSSSLHLSGTTGKIIIDGRSGYDDKCAIINNGKLSLGRNVIVRNYSISLNNESVISNASTLILDGCDIYDITSVNGVISNTSTVIISSGNFYQNRGGNCAFLYNNNGEVVVNGGSIYSNSGSILTSTGGSVFLNSGIIQNNRSESGSVINITEQCKLYLSSTRFFLNENREKYSDINTGSGAVVIEMNDANPISVSSLPMKVVDVDYKGSDDSLPDILFIMLASLCFILFAVIVSSKKRMKFTIRNR